MRYLAPFLLIVLMLPAQAADLPKRKPGLWDIKITTAGGPGGGSMASQHCIDNKTDDLLQQRTQGTGKQACSKNNVRREGGKTIVESVCKLNNTTATTKAVFSGDFSSHYRADIHAAYDPPMMGMKTSDSTIEAKWLGACKPGQKPGDVIVPGLPGGGKFNMEEMMKHLPKR